MAGAIVVQPTSALWPAGIGADQATRRPLGREHFPALDGLRGISALLVILCHYGDFSLGRMGVDFFFVLSGFLITGILYDSKDNPHPYRDFYLRRSLRIFPLYYGVLGLLFLLTWPAGYHWPWQMSFWPAYLGNLLPPFVGGHIFFGIGPFAIGHFWSLCVEEQFYLIWPAVVLRMRDRERITKLCLALIVIIWIARAMVSMIVPEIWLKWDLVYGNTLFRVDSLLLGAVLAMRLRGEKRAQTLRAGGSLAIGSGVSLAFCAGIAYWMEGSKSMETSARWLGAVGFPLMSLLGAGLVLLCVNQTSAVASLLKARRLRRLGEVSYGVYVFHLLPLAIFGVIGKDLRNAGVSPFAVNVMVTCIDFWMSYHLARLSYRYWETPFLRLKDRLTAPGVAAEVPSGA